MLQMLLEYQAKWNAKVNLTWERIAADQVYMAAEKDQSAAKHVAPTEQCTAGPQPLSS